MNLFGAKPAYVPPPPSAPTLANSSVQLAGQRLRAGAAASAGGTILTSPQGLVTPASTTKKSLLGG